MKYDFQDLSPDQFESLVVFLCKEILGISVQGFSSGHDGGRDAKFVGTAQLHPSKTAPWSGVVIIQAKHTNGSNKRFSDSDFFSKGRTNTTIGKEIPKIRRLKANGQLDHYMLFANRRLSGVAETEIGGYIAHKTGIATKSIYLCGVEQLDAWIKKFPAVGTLAGISPVDSPLIVSPDDLADLIEAFDRNMDTFEQVAEKPPTPRVSYERKNVLNNMSADYAKRLRKAFLKDTAPIQAFLANPENIGLRDKYQGVVTEFDLKIIAKWKDEWKFDVILEYLADLLFNRDPLLRSKKRLTRAMLFYMYWHCDIGKSEDDD